jgi:hypothetical protein
MSEHVESAKICVPMNLMSRVNSFSSLAASLLRPSSLCLLIGLAAIVSPAAHGQSLDPEFAKVPFDQWFAGGKQAPIKWSARIFPPRLSSHQRLWATVRLQIDGADLAKRRGQGQLLMYFQVTDIDGRRYQDHGIFDLEKPGREIKSSDLIYTERVSLTPGDYRVALALYSTATREHTVKERKLHVPALNNDPLPDVWRDLPPVEIVPIADPPDSWFLPTVRGRLHAAPDAPHPLTVEVIVNVTPTEELTLSRNIQDRNLGVLIAPLKVISEVASRNISLNVELVDLSHRRVIFRQESVRGLDWEGMKAALVAQKPPTIDVQSLEDRGRDASFFMKEVESRSAGEDSTPRILIILSRPMSFKTAQELRPASLAARPASKVFYLRCHSQWMPRVGSPEGYTAETGGPRRGAAGLPRGPAQMARATMPDQLAPLFAPLAARLFDVETPEQFRKALATLLGEISGM